MTWNKSADGLWREIQWTGSPQDYPNYTTDAIVDTPYNVTIDNISPLSTVQWLQKAHSLALSNGGSVTVDPRVVLTLITDSSVGIDSTLRVYGDLQVPILNLSGTLQVGDGGTTGTIAGNIVDDGTVIFNRSDDVMFAGNVSGSGSFVSAGAGGLTLAGTNDYTGTTTVEAGMLQLIGAAAQNPVLNLGGANIQFGKLVLDYTDSGTSPTAIDTLMKNSYANNNWNTNKFQSTTHTTANTLGWKDDSVNKLITVAWTLYGDANLDGSVNLSDLGFLGDNYGATSGATWAMGDFNYDGRVNLSDLGFLGDQYGGHVVGFVTTGPANPAPEPGTLVLLAMASVGLGFYGARGAKRPGPLKRVAILVFG